MKKLPNIVLTHASLAHAAMVLKENLREVLEDPTIQLPVMQAYNGSPSRFFKAVEKVTGLRFPNVSLNASAINSALTHVREYYEEGDIAPPIPNETTFVSAEVPMTSGGNHVMVTLSDANGYESISSEWGVKINGVDAPDIGVSGKNTASFHVGVGPNGTVKAGDTVVVSHLIAASGIVKFIDQPVTVNVPA